LIAIGKEMREIACTKKENIRLLATEQQYKTLCLEKKITRKIKAV